MLADPESCNKLPLALRMLASGILCARVTCPGPFSKKNDRPHTVDCIGRTFISHWAPTLSSMSLRAVNSGAELH
jgi:hypothetical protein